MREAIQRKGSDARVNGRDQLREWKRRVEGGEEQRPEPLEPDARQIVRRRGELADVFELGHGEEASVQTEAAAVVTAAQRLHGSFLDAEKVPAMRADVRERPQSPAGILREQERLVNGGIQEYEGKHRAGPIGALRAVHELPAAPEDPLEDALEDRVLAIERGGQRARATDVLVDHPTNLASVRGGAHVVALLPSL